MDIGTQILKKITQITQIKINLILVCLVLESRTKIQATLKT